MGSSNLMCKGILIQSRMENERIEELQTAICHLSKENARLYEAYFDEMKKVNNIEEHDKMKQKRIDELEKMLAENEQKRFTDERKKILKGMRTMRKRLSIRGKKHKHGETFAELQEGRKKLIEVFETLSLNDVGMGAIGVKRLGQLSFTPFHKAMEKAGHKGANALFMASNLCSVWENLIRNEVIDGDEENLKGLLHDIGEEVYHAVAMALMEVNEYNPKGHRNVVTELWNFKEDRKATLKEGITFVAERYLEPLFIRDHIIKQGKRD